MDDTRALGTAGRPIRIAIVEDQKMLADFLAGWFSQQRGFQVAGCADCGDQGLELCAAGQVDVALLDIELPDWDGLELGQELLRRHPALRVLSMSGRTDPYTIWRVQEAGLHGFVDKGQNPALLSKAILAVAAGEKYFSSTFDKVKKESLEQAEAFHKILSSREQSVLRGVAAGLSDDMIALELEITPATVSAHRKNIRQKLELHNDRELVAYARRWGLHKVTV
jgi:DNA-binding NarL/FixJ family response regulator